MHPLSILSTSHIPALHPHCQGSPGCFPPCKAQLGIWHSDVSYLGTNTVLIFNSMNYCWPWAGLLASQDLNHI